MTHQLQTPAPAPARPSSIAVLRCAEPFVMDAAPLANLCGDKSQNEAENIVCRALSDIALRLDQLQDMRGTGAFSEMALPARRIAAISLQLGLSGVRQSADHVARAAQTQNSVAIGATLARLERGFDMAVSLIWNYEEAAP